MGTRYTLLKQLGSGSFSSVVSAKDNDTQELVSGVAPRLQGTAQLVPGKGLAPSCSCLYVSQVSTSLFVMLWRKGTEAARCWGHLLHERCLRTPAQRFASTYRLHASSVWHSWLPHALYGSDMSAQLHPLKHSSVDASSWTYFKGCWQRVPMLQHHPC